MVENVAAVADIFWLKDLKGQIAIIFIISIYTLSDLSDLSNLIGSLSQTIQH